MKPQDFYPRITDFVARPAHERQHALLVLHTDIVEEYLAAVEAITPERAAHVLPHDGRTIAQVVGHIMEWERWLITAAGEMAAGVAYPQIMRRQGYVDADGHARSFDSVDAFNAHQEAMQKSLDWETIQALALGTASDLQILFCKSGLLPAERLEQTRRFRWKLPTGDTLTVPCGWFLWMVTLEHEAVEHEGDLKAGLIK